MDIHPREKQDMTFGVIGCGRFGSLWASRLSEIGEVLVYDKRAGRAEHLMHEVEVQAVPLEHMGKVDVLFIAVPLSEFESVVRSVQPHVSANTVVVDMCAVKMYPEKVMRKIFPKEQPLIGLHPLFGPDSVARLGMVGRKVVVCDGRTEKKKYQRIIALLKAFGLTVIETTPREHDKAMAKSHALVHFIGRGLSGLHLKEEDIVTVDYETLLRMQSLVINDTWQMFHDMQTYNPYAQKEREALMRSMQQVEAKLHTDTATARAKKNR